MNNSLLKSKNLSDEKSFVSYKDRIKRSGHKGMVLWFTGLSGSGKSTLAKNLEKELFEQGKQVIVLDGDNIRKGLNQDLGFSKKDRSENIRRVAQTAKLFANSGFIVIASFISPYEEDRKKAKEIIGSDFFHLIYIKSSLEDCKKRDPKGLYKKAMKGEIKNFTGIDDVYEEPDNVNLEIDTKLNSISESILNFKNFINSYIKNFVNL